jgi:hypothetical protein
MIRDWLRTMLGTRDDGSPDPEPAEVRLERLERRDAESRARASAAVRRVLTIDGANDAQRIVRGRR